MLFSPGSWVSFSDRDHAPYMHPALEPLLSLAKRLQDNKDKVRCGRTIDDCVGPARSAGLPAILDKTNATGFMYQ